MSDNKIIKANEEQPNDSVESFDESAKIEIGQWYWVDNIHNDEDDGYYNSEEEKWLGCVVHIGTNFVEIHSPHGRTSYKDIRVHFNNMDKRLTFEPNAKSVINSNIANARLKVEENLEKVKQITARLGVSNKTGISHKDESNKSLSVISGTSDPNDYKKSLIKAKEEELPALFEEIEDANQELAKWMSAESVPLTALANSIKDCLEDVEDRIFSVTLYAGLTENIYQFAKGEPADFAEPLHLMQRRLYMDEECLLNYKHGGMEFKNIKQFDKWLAKKENRDRVFPFPRCMVSFRVRREKKERFYDGSLMTALINIQLEQEDKLTFLYIRNGDNLYRMNCDLDFDEKLFPSQTEFDPSEDMMVKMYGDSVDEIISVREYEELKKEYDYEHKKYEEEKKIRKQWMEDNDCIEPDFFANDPDYDEKQKKWRKKINECPFGGYWHSSPHNSFRPDNWKPLDQNNVYFDECMLDIAKTIKQYNRIALIIQGLFDRSECLHPHPPVKTWDHESFTRSVTLVYDGSGLLHYGAAPDFEEYRKEGLKSLTKDSVVIGQKEFWLKREAEKENLRTQNSWREKDTYYDHYQPYGDNGPGYMAHIDKLKPRAGKASFTWKRYRKNDYGQYRDMVKDSITVDVEHLFNVSAYKLGDYKQFFEDPRTREQYIRWAPILLTAEEYHAGNEKARKPLESGEGEEREYFAGYE